MTVAAARVIAVSSRGRSCARSCSRPAVRAFSHWCATRGREAVLPMLPAQAPLATSLSGARVQLERPSRWSPIHIDHRPGRPNTIAGVGSRRRLHRPSRRGSITRSTRVPGTYTLWPASQVRARCGGGARTSSRRPALSVSSHGVEGSWSLSWKPSGHSLQTCDPAGE